MGRKTNKVLTCTQEEIDAILPENKELIDDFMDYLEATDHSQKTCIVYQEISLLESFLLVRLTIIMRL